MAPSTIQHVRDFVDQCVELEAILFDLDGTLISFTHSYHDYIVKTTARHWGIIDQDDPFFQAYSTAALSEGAVTYRSATQHALLAADRPIPSDFEQRCEEAVATYVSGIELLPWAHDLLGKYSHLPKALVSNGPYDMQLGALQKVGLHEVMDSIVISGAPDVAVRKPNAAIFEIACQRLGVAPGRALMIGDNEKVDVQGAKDAGLKACLVTEILSSR
jgi:putative hydrolase of the HAD superfamily